MHEAVRASNLLCTPLISNSTESVVTTNPVRWAMRFLERFRPHPEQQHIIRKS